MGEKLFNTNDILSVVTGRLMGDIGGVYEVLNWMTGENLFTHQLPRVRQEGAPVIVARHPHLQEAIEESAEVTPDNWKTWLSTWTDRYGPQIAVPTMNNEQHERIDPMSEAAEYFAPSQTIVVRHD
jgi:hypothetical protein